MFKFKDMLFPDSETFADYILMHRGAGMRFKRSALVADINKLNIGERMTIPHQGVVELVPDPFMEIKLLNAALTRMESAWARAEARALRCGETEDSMPIVDFG